MESTGSNVLSEHTLFRIRVQHTLHALTIKVSDKGQTYSVTEFSGKYSGHMCSDTECVGMHMVSRVRNTHQK